MKDYELEEFVRNVLVKDGLGILDPTDVEINTILGYPMVASSIFAYMISKRAQIGWSTHGHSAVDVNIYGSKGTEVLRGNHENTDVGKFLRDYLNVDVEAITRELNEKASAFEIQRAGWTGRVPSEEDLRTAENHYNVQTLPHGF